MSPYPDLWVVLGDACPERPEEVGGWRDSLVPLAVRRGWPLLAVAGVPPAIASRPAGLLRVARHLIRRLDALPSHQLPVRADAHGRWVNETLIAEATAELAAAISLLGRAYGPAAARELVEWLIRNEVRRAIRDHWQAWSFFLIDVASGRAELPATLGGRSEMVQRLIETTFSRAARERLLSLEEVASAIPLSGTERRLAAYPDFPDEPPMSVDAVGDLALAAGRERARLVFGLLAATLTEAELEVLTEGMRAREGISR